MLLRDDSDVGTAETLISGGVERFLQRTPQGDWLGWDYERNHWSKYINQVIGRYTREIISSKETSALAHYKRLRSAPGQQRVLEVLAGREKFNDAPWNLEEDLIGTDNGVFKLRTGNFRQARPEDFVSLRTKAGYNPDAKAPRWDRFLREILPAAELQEYIHRLLGSGLVGSACDQLFHFFYGDGSNGKGRIAKAIENTLGPYVGTVSSSLFIKQSDQSANRFSLARLAGTRLIFTQEVPQGRFLDEVRVKQLTGEDSVVGEEKFKNQFEMYLNATIIMTCNHIPKISDSSHAMMRRLRIVPFEQKFEGEGKDRQIDAQLAVESEGILLWLIDGAQKWLRDGLTNSKIVQETTQKHIREAFTTFDFFEETIESCPDGRITLADIRTRYVAWMRQRNQSVWLSDGELGKAVRDYTKYEGTDGKGHGTFYRGWQFKEEEVSFNAPFR